MGSNRAAAKSERLAQRVEEASAPTGGAEVLARTRKQRRVVPICFEQVGPGACEFEGATVVRTFKTSRTCRAPSLWKSDPGNRSDQLCSAVGARRRSGRRCCCLEFRRLANEANPLALQRMQRLVICVSLERCDGPPRGLGSLQESRWPAQAARPEACRVRKFVRTARVAPWPALTVRFPSGRRTLRSLPASGIRAARIIACAAAKSAEADRRTPSR